MTPGRWVALLVLIGAALFAWRAGSYSSTGYRALAREVRETEQYRARLTFRVDSLRALRDSLRDNPVVQERFAREQWGMVREGEMPFRIVVIPPADSAR